MTRSLFLPLTLNQTSINVPPLSILHEALLKTSSMQESVIQNSSDSMGSKNKITQENKVCCVGSPWAVQKEQRKKRNRRKYNTHAPPKQYFKKSTVCNLKGQSFTKNTNIEPVVISTDYDTKSVLKF